MGRTINYDDARKILEKTFEEAEGDYQKDLIVKVPKIIEASTAALFASNTQAFREALVGCLLARLLDPGIDITMPYMNQGNDAFNGRALDERVVNPFLHQKGIPSSKGPYLSALRRSVSFVPETQKGVRDKEAFGALLSFITEAASAKKKDTKSFLLFLLSHFIELREKSYITPPDVDQAALVQRPSSHRFDRQNNRIEATPVTEPPFDAILAETIIIELREKAIEALSLLTDNNADDVVKRAITRLLELLQSSSTGMAEGILLMRANTLSAHRRAYADPGSELERAIRTVLDDLSSSVDNLADCYPGLRQINANRLALDMQAGQAPEVEIAIDEITEIARRSPAVGRRPLRHLTRVARTFGT